jgi:hypothetical protein
MTLRPTSISMTSGLQRRLADSSVDEARARDGRNVALVIAVLAILVMVVM